MRAVELKTEHLTNPIGIDIVNPRLQGRGRGGNYLEYGETLVG